MRINIVPAICKAKEDGTPAAYEGFIEMRLPDNIERLEILEEYGIELGDDGEEGVAAQVKRRGNLALVKFLTKKAPAFIEKVQIKRLDDGFLFDSWETAKYDSEVAAVATEIGWKLIQGHKVGNDSAPN